MKNLFIRQFILLVFVFVLQSAALNVFSESAYLVPMLTAVYVIIFALTNPLPRSIWFAFMTGFLMETFSTFAFGSYISAFMITALISYYITRKLTAREISFPIVVYLVSVGTILFPLLVYGFAGFRSLILSENLPPFGALYSWGIILTIGINIIFAYFVRGILIFLQR